MKKRFVATLFAAGLVAGAAQAQDVPVGAIEILSGPSAAYGIAIRGGLELALQQVADRAASFARLAALHSGFTACPPN